MDELVLLQHRELEIAVRVWHPDAPRTVIAWHGLSRHGGDFEFLARLLGPRWRLIAPDTPGRGLSSWSLFPAYDYLYAHYMRIAIAVLDHFELTSVPWLGTSMGGLLGLLLAADASHGHRVAALILNDVGPTVEAKGLQRLANHFISTQRFTTLQSLESEIRDHYQSFGIDSEAVWQRLLLGSARRLPDGSWSHHFDPRIAEQFVHDTPRDLWAAWKALHCPLMTIRGMQSDILSRQTLSTMRHHQPSTRILEVPGCGHAPMLDKASQSAPIAAFLDTPRVRERCVPSTAGDTWWQRLLRTPRQH
ncbi:alpha/beta hydrolase [Chromohalobacter sp. TMW 2.2308]|uniref:alpha/beta fold hydrolase n=1 Tax=Chromohalobacter TaxID=42054 RepID=UPI001FFCDB87|nr:alpha/beta hydrolase [Chromohalobacter moromii]MCT8513644.1 alpha/beta hydrolase [Chromohalobacter sp. TMW 2.2271]